MRDCFTILGWAENLEPPARSRPVSIGLRWIQMQTGRTLGHQKLDRHGEDGNAARMLFWDLACHHGTRNKAARTGELRRSDGSAMSLEDVATIGHVSETRAATLLTLLASVGWLAAPDGHAVATSGQTVANVGQSTDTEGKGKEGKGTEGRKREVHTRSVCTNLWQDITAQFVSTWNTWGAEVNTRHPLFSAQGKPSRRVRILRGPGGPLRVTLEKAARKARVEARAFPEAVQAALGAMATDPYWMGARTKPITPENMLRQLGHLAAIGEGDELTLDELQPTTERQQADARFDHAMASNGLNPDPFAEDPAHVAPSALPGTAHGNHPRIEDAAKGLPDAGAPAEPPGPAHPEGVGRSPHQHEPRGNPPGHPADG